VGATRAMWLDFRLEERGPSSKVPGPMNRPARQLANVKQKLADKEARAKATGRKLGKKAKQWRQDATKHEAVAAG
jgi:hypothetical protein